MGYIKLWISLEIMVGYTPRKSQKAASATDAVLTAAVVLVPPLPLSSHPRIEWWFLAANVKGAGSDPSTCLRSIINS